MFRFLRWQGVGALMVVGLMGCLNEGSKNESPKGVMEQTEAAPIELPRCEPSDARIRVDYWMPEYLEWKSSLSSVPEERNGRVVYIKFWMAADPAGTCGAEGALHLRAAQDLSLPLDGVEVAFKGNSSFVQGACHVEGFFMNHTHAGMWQGWTTTTYEALPTKDILLSGRHCLGSRVPEPPAEVAHGLGAYDRLLTVRQVAWAHPSEVGDEVALKLTFDSAVQAAPQEAFCKDVVCESLLRPGGGLGPGAKVKVAFGDDPSTPGNEHWVARLQVLTPGESVTLAPAPTAVPEVDYDALWALIQAQPQVFLSDCRETEARRAAHFGGMSPAEAKAFAAQGCDQLLVGYRTCMRQPKAQAKDCLAYQGED